MRTLFTSVLLACFQVLSIAQQPGNAVAPASIDLHKPLSVPAKHTASPQPDMGAPCTGNVPMYIDYDQAEFDLVGSPPYTWFAWPMNEYFTSPTNSGTLKYAIVTIDSIHDAYTGVGYEYSGITSITIDSIFLTVGHQNLSGLDDTITISIITLNNQGYPTSTVLWSTDFTTSISLSPLSWLNMVTLQVAPSFTVTPPNKIGVRVNYKAPLIDTLGILSGFTDGGPCPAGASVSAFESLFPVNSYYYYVGPNPGITGLWPNASGGVIYFDCNGNGSYDPGSNEEFFIQNTGIWIRATVNTAMELVAPDATLCVGAGSVQLSASGLDTCDCSWSPPTGLNCTDCCDPVASPLATTSYTVTCYGTDGCMETETVTVTVSPLPVVNAGTDVSVCDNESVQLSASGAVSYSWSPPTGLSCTNCQSPIASPPATTIYTVTGTDAFGCSNTDEVTVDVLPAPVVTVTPTDTTVSPGQPVQLLATGADTYSWMPTTGLSDPTGPNPTVTLTTSTCYTVTGTAVNGCTNQDVACVTIYTSVNDPSAGLSWTMYPNPARDEITLEGRAPEGVVRIELLDALGQALMVRDLTGPDFSEVVSIRDLPSATYVVRVVSGSSASHRPLTVSRAD